MTILLFVLGCEVLWITPEMYREQFGDVSDPNEDADLDGFTVNDGDCDDSDPEVYPGQSEFYGNEVDDNCDGLTDPGNGTAYFSFHAGNNPNIYPYWQFYNQRGSEEPAFDHLLLPQHDWEVTFLLVQPPKTELESEATANGDAVYVLFARDEVVLGYRPFGDTEMELLLIFQPTRPDWLYYRVLLEDIVLTENTILTIQYLGSETVSGEDCTSESPALNVFQNNIEVPSGNLGLVGNNDLSICRFSDDSPMTFADHNANVAGLQAFDGAIDDLIIVEQGLSLGQREMLIEQIRVPPNANAADSTDYERPEGIEIMWQNVDSHEESCDVGFTDDVALINASWENCSEGAIEYTEPLQ